MAKKKNKQKPVIECSSLPCICSKCALCKSGASKNNEDCLLVESRAICRNVSCDECTFTCERFTTILLRKDSFIDIIE